MTTEIQTGEPAGDGEGKREPWASFATSEGSLAERCAAAGFSAETLASMQAGDAAADKLRRSLSGCACGPYQGCEICGRYQPRITRGKE